MTPTGERFTFAGLHLNDRTVVRRRATHKLHVEMPHVEPPATGFPHQSERLDQQ
jgi:hypothetical protein